jgi:plastocyanin
MKQSRYFYPVLFCLLVAFALFSGCTGGNEKVNHLPAPEPAATKDADTSQPASPPAKREHTATVEIKGMKFNPEVLTIHKGDTVEWVNNDLTTHCVTEKAKNWASPEIASGSSWKKAMTQNTDYFCAIHVVMNGRIKVE